MKVLVVIPARGGSKGIPRKNLRALAGMPLLSYSIKTAQASRYKPDIFVSTDDEEISAIARKLGAYTIERDPFDAQDATTLDPVIYGALQVATARAGCAYDVVVTLQPTSPLLRTASLDRAIDLLLTTDKLDTIISARDDTHLTWGRKDGKFLPNYEARVNRQYLEPVFRETGGFLITRSSHVTKNNRIGENVELYSLSGGEEIDIDTYEDWGLCEYYLKRKKILFVVSGYREIGLGHVYNTLLIANDILNHQIEFLVDSSSDLAFAVIQSKNYPVFKQQCENIVDDIRLRAPDVVINDKLDTGAAYISKLKSEGYLVINFEDLGEGARLADMVINAIYPEKTVLPRHYFGHEYFVLRDEFLLTSAKPTSRRVDQVLLTFGGVDPNNFSLKVLEAIHSYCGDNNIRISVVAGFGYAQYDSLSEFDSVDVYRNSMDIAEHMRCADIIFTSAGRTTYEVAALAIPAIVLAQNERETTHFFASADNGFLNLGLGVQVSHEAILAAFKELVEDYAARHHIAHIMSSADLSSGRQRVIRLINDTVEGRI